MTRTQYYTATSLDGFIADQHNSLDWLFEADQSSGGTEDRFAAFFSGVAAMAMGRTTYQWVLDHEHVLDEPDKWRKWYGNMPTWVFAHGELPAVPGADVRFVAGDVSPVHREMVSAAGGKNIWLVGGGELVGQFADAGLLDEVIVGVAPVVLGGGAPLLPRRLTGLRLAGTQVLGGTFVELRYTLPKTEEPRPSETPRTGGDGK